MITIGISNEEFLGMITDDLDTGRGKRDGEITLLGHQTRAVPS
jgi:hypothetical protein